MLRRVRKATAAVIPVSLMGHAGADDAGMDAGADDAGMDAGADDAGMDAGADDAGTDAGADDAGVIDAGPDDAGPGDAGTTDTGLDAGPDDAGSDAGVIDAGADAGPDDAGAIDAGPPGPFDGGFLAGPSYSVSGATSLACKDFTRDGILDLLVVNNSDTVRVLVGQGDGGFATATPYASGHNYPAVGDFNLDGWLDVAHASYASGTLTLLFGQPNAAFSAPTTLTGASGAGGATTADLNGDGLLDLLVAQYGVSPNPGVGVHYAMDAGVFGPRVQLVGDSNYSPVTGDFNQDGWLDLAATTVSGGTVTTVWLSAGDGGFLPRTAWPAGANANEATAADFDGDGRLDLLDSNYTGASVTVLLGQDGGTFSAPLNTTSGNGPAFHATADFNLDGRLDVVTANYTAGTITLLWGLGNGLFVRGPDVSTSGTPNDAVAGDFNGDGRPDVAVAAGNSVRIFFGR